MSQYTGGTHPNNIGAGVQEYSVALTAATVTTAGAVASIANPLGVELLIIDAFVRVATVSTGAANIDVGVGATAATASDTLFDGLDVNAAAGVFDARNDTHNGTNGGPARIWGVSQYVTGKASATLAGLVGTLHLIYIRT